MNGFMNNPIIDMFKNPMEMWSKGFDQQNWIDLSGKMMESMSWLKSVYNNDPNKTPTDMAARYAENLKNMSGFADLGKLSLENAQAMMRRQAEVIQKHSVELSQLIHDINTSRNPQENMAKQAEFIKSSLEDFRELTEMYAKFNLETLEAAGNKVSEHMNHVKEFCCPSKMSEVNPSKTKK